MIERLLLCVLLLSGMTWAQDSNSEPTLKSRPTLSSPSDSQPAATASVPADAPVITIAGICEHAPDTNPPAAGCKTVITRSQFEDVVNAIAPSMPATARRQFAGRYALALVMSEKAVEMGVDHGPRFDQLMKIARMQVLAQQLSQTLQAKANDVPEKDIEDYYQKNITTFEQVDAVRIFVPRAQQLDPPHGNVSAAEADKRRQDSEQHMREVAEKIRVRAAAGEDFVKLQTQAYQEAGFKNPPPTPKTTSYRRSSLPAAQAAVFDLKSGELSGVIADASGYYIYRVESKQTLPLNRVHDEIYGLRKSQRLQESMQALQQSAMPSLNPEYFGEASAAPTAAPGAPAGQSARPK